MKSFNPRRSGIAAVSSPLAILAILALPVRAQVASVNATTVLKATTQAYADHKAGIDQVISALEGEAVEATERSNESES